MHNKTEYTYKKCLPVRWNLEISHISLVAGDYFVKPEDIRHVPRTSFANSSQKS